MKTVLVTGGTGLVGQALSKALMAKGYKVIVLSRSLHNKEAVGTLQYALWNVNKQEIDIEAIEAADYIIHLAGAGVVEKKWTDAYKKEILQSRTESSRLLVESLKKNKNKVQTVVSSSAIGWYGEDSSPLKPFTETDEADVSFLGQTCKYWEDSIEPVTNLGIRLVKLRTGIVLSNEGGALAEFIKPIRLGIAAILGSGKQMVSWIHIDDLCRMYIAAIENNEIQGSYNAVAPLPVSNATLTIQLAKIMKGNFYITAHVPAFILRLMMGERSTEILKSTTVSCNKILETGFVFNFKTIEMALADLVK